MTRLSRFWTVAVLLGGATVSLSACSDDSGPVASAAPSPAVVASETPSVSPSPTARSDEQLLELIPEGARQENFGSAVNFSKFFILEYQRMFVERDPGLIDLLSGPECEFCKSALGTFAKLEEAGQNRDGGDVTVDLRAAVGGLQDDGTYNVTLPMSTGPTETLDDQGVVVGTSDGGAGLAAFSLRYTDSHWVVLGVNLQHAAG